MKFKFLSFCLLLATITSCSKDSLLEDIPENINPNIVQSEPITQHLDSKISITWESGYTAGTRTIEPHVTISSIIIGVVHNGDTIFYTPDVSENIQEPIEVSNWGSLPAGLTMKWQSLFNNNSIPCTPSDTIITTLNYTVREKQLSVDDVVTGQITDIQTPQSQTQDKCITNTALFITDRLIPIVFSATIEDYNEVNCDVEVGL